MGLSLLEEKKQSLILLNGSSPSKPHQRSNPTCGHEQDPSSQDDVPLAFVEAAGGDADSAEQQQDGAEDGEDAGGSHHTCEGGGRQSAREPLRRPGQTSLCCVGRVGPVSNLNERGRHSWQDGARRHLKVQRLVTLRGETTVLLRRVRVYTTIWPRNMSYMLMYYKFIDY